MNSEKAIEFANLILDWAKDRDSVQMLVCDEWRQIGDGHGFNMCYEYRRKPTQLGMWMWWNPNQTPAPGRIFQAYDSKEECVAANSGSAGFPINLTSETLRENRKPKPQEVWIWRYPGGALHDMNYVERRDCIGLHGGGDGTVVRFVEADPQ